MPQRPERRSRIPAVLFWTLPIAGSLYGCSGGNATFGLLLGLVGLLAAIALAAMAAETLGNGVAESVSALPDRKPRPVLVWPIGIAAVLGAAVGGPFWGNTGALIGAAILGGLVFVSLRLEL